MLKLFYGVGACSRASHITLEEAGAAYEPIRLSLKDGEQRKPVGKGDQHLEAVEAVGAPPVRGTPRQPEAEPGERERGKVGEHMAGVGEKSERAGGDATRHLSEHEETRDERR